MYYVSLEKKKNLQNLKYIQITNLDSLILKKKIFYIYSINYTLLENNHIILRMV